ncbi:HER136Wp [Eremothecium sinecaudum]|uniref:HER136Wp n=1 Tax=Eremothecium sinecaudum TaxID=45286 RepID=A0A0X8HTX6_9SACH|nr:HER136Wp [Eremothecium sinecaudum]AMD21415.1 HER136Wp [Eremothecium sinecaudum]
MTNNGVQSKKLDEVLKRSPQFTNNTPIDAFFRELEEALVSKVKSSEGNNVYLQTSCDSNHSFVLKCLDYFKRLHVLVLNKEKISDDKNLLPISLHDMASFDMLVNLIVIHGIYANLPLGIGVPLPERQLANFKEERNEFKVPSNHVRNIETLKLAAETFYDVFKKTEKPGDTIRDILLKGTGYLDAITALVSLAVDLPDEKLQYTEKLEALEATQDTYQLVSVYTLLVRTTTSTKYRELPLLKLSLLSVNRPDGVSSVIDFVVNVREEEQINVENFKLVNQILLAKPKTLTNVQYFLAIFPQIYDGLAEVNRPILVSSLNNLVSGFYYKNKRIVEDFLFRRVNKILFNPNAEGFSEKQLNDCINVLISLSKNPSTEVIAALVSSNDAKSFYLHLWIYALFLRKNQKLKPGSGSSDTAPYYHVIFSLIKSYMKVNSNTEFLEYIVNNLVNFDHDNWEYKINLETQLPYIVPKSPDNILERLTLKDDNTAVLQQLSLDVDFAIEALIEFLTLWNDNIVTKEVFLSTLRRWVKNQSKSNTLDAYQGDLSQNLLTLVDLKLLEQMNEKLKMNLLEKPHDVLQVIYDLLDFAYNHPDQASQLEPDSDDEEEEEQDLDKSNHLNTSFSILIELLLAILSSTDGKTLAKDTALLKHISKKLRVYPANPSCSIASGKIEAFVLNNVDKPHSSSLEIDELVLDSALANLNDNLAPIKAHALHELRQLIKKNSPVISVKHVLDLHIHQLKDPEPFVYLNVIKSLSEICLLSPDQSIPYLLTTYRDTKPAYKLDLVLRIGEVFVNYITAEGEMFQGTYAVQIVQTCLSTIPQRDAIDNRIRMSAMSLLGLVFQANALAIAEYVTDTLDCIFGILQLEKTATTMRRSAIYLIYDIMQTSAVEFIPEQYNREKLISLLEYVRIEEQDYLVCENIDKVLNILSQ